MSQRIAIDCDVCQARGEQSPGQPIDIAVRVAGGAFRFFTIDVCADHAKPIQDVLSEVAEQGRAFEGDIARTIGKSNPQGRKPEPGDNACPHCGKSYRTRTSLGAHLRNVHSSSLAEEFGEAPAPKTPCPVCGDPFAAQGLTSHLRTRHPEWKAA